MKQGANTKESTLITRIFFTLSIQVLFNLNVLAQPDSIGVMIPKDDGSRVNWYTKHMWVGQSNPIASNYVGGYKFLKVWTDNGIVDSGDFYFSNYAITPRKEGPITVYSIQCIWKGKQYDTITTTSIFTALPYPNLTIKINDISFKVDSTLILEIFDKELGKKANSRYQIGRMFVPLIYDASGKLIGYPNEYFTEKIDLSYNNTGKVKIEPGQTLKMKVLIRDTQTDLLIGNEEVTYKIK